MKSVFDHLVIGALTLDQGVEYVKKHLGIQLPFGGCHPQMGTHNCVARLSATTFLEIIAIDPEGSAPEQPRWFGLDDPHLRQRLSRSPCLLTWVVNCRDITSILEGPEISFGIPRAISRGELRWYFGVPDDGRLIAGGILPYIISWQNNPHPAAKMAESKCHLLGLTIRTPFVDWTARQLEKIGALSLVDLTSAPPGSTPSLLAALETPAGERLLDSGE